ncbi:NTP transferase domain-containing protein [Halobellus rufus]|uniref:NTP transferase domain-containing protein n=1 Tax=Halobellus rufus TaxID=1448860 RepID=UPI0006786A2B|nr:NTP transferase domain-containing protein [Halobellus rufus]
MCGGRGTRLRGDTDDGRGIEATEKPLVEIGGVSMFDRVVDALSGSQIGRSEAGEGTIRAVVSPNAPATAERARERSLPVVETPGEGYVDDLNTALEAVGRPVLTVPADLPLLAPEHVDDAVERARSAHSSATAEPEPTSLTVCVPAALKRRLGASLDTAFDHGGRSVAPTGLNVVGGDDDTVALTYDARLAVNVNRPEDVALAEDLCE